MPSWETERNLVFPIHRVVQCWLACTMSTSNGNVLEVSDSSEEESEEDEYETEEDNKEDENEAEVEDEPGEACARLPKAKGASISRVSNIPTIVAVCSLGASIMPHCVANGLLQ